MTMGRPRSFEGPTIKVSVVVPTETARTLRVMAAEQGVSIAQLVDEWTRKARLLEAVDRGCTPQAELLDGLLGNEPLLIGDLVMAEVLQGFQNDRDFNKAKQLLTSFQVINVVDTDIAIQAARNFRILRAHGVTVRKTIDTLIATRCIKGGLVLLHSDRDFDPFEAHLGLRVALKKV